MSNQFTHLFNKQLWYVFTKHEWHNRKLSKPHPYFQSACMSNGRNNKVIDYTVW